MNIQKMLMKINSDVNYTELRRTVADFLLFLNNQEQSFENIKICKTLLNEKHDLLSSEERIEVYYILAKNTYYKKDLDSSKNYCNIALEILNTNFNNSDYQTNINYLYTILYNLLATIEIEKGKIMEGIVYYGLAFEKSILSTDIHLKNVILANIGISCTSLGLYQQALELFSIAKQNFLAKFNPKKKYLYISLANIYLYEATCYANLNKLDKAKQAIQNIKKYINIDENQQFKYYYYNLQVLINNKKGNYQEADRLFSKVFNYFVNNENADKTLEIINSYLKEYFKREKPNIDYLYQLKENSNKNIAGWKNYYFMTNLKYFDMQMLIANNNINNFKDNYLEYKNITKKATKKYLEQNKKTIQDQYEHMLTEKASKNYEQEKLGYKHNTKIIEKEKIKYRKYSNRLNFINKLVEILEVNNSFENKLQLLRSELANKMVIENIAVAVLNKKTNEISFILAEPNKKIVKFSKQLNELSEQLIYNFQQNHDEAIIIKRNSGSNLIRELSKNIAKSLIFKLFENDKVNAISILQSSNEEDFTKEEIFLYETFAPYLSAELQNFILKKQIQEIRDDKKLSLKKLKKLHKTLIVMPNLDPLTQIPNKSHFHFKSMQLYRRSIQDKKALCFLFIDIDNFANYNLKYGYQEGDKTIKTIAQNLYSEYNDFEFFNNENSVFARYTRDLFVLMFVNYHNIEIETLAIKFIEKVTTLKLEHQASVNKYISICIGASYLNEFNDFNIQEQFDYTQKLLNIAKMKGENSYIINQFKLNKKENYEQNSNT